MNIRLGGENTTIERGISDIHLRSLVKVEQHLTGSAVIHCKTRHIDCRPANINNQRSVRGNVKLDIICFCQSRGIQMNNIEGIRRIYG